jgi:hypothetical protein
VSFVHPDLANLEQLYIRTRADVTSGRLQGQEGIARVQANTVVDAAGRVWMVDPMSPDPQRATFKMIAPGQAPVPADPSQYQASSAAAPYDMGTMGGYPPQMMPMEAPEKKGRFRRDKSSAAVKPAGGTLGKVRELPKWIWLAGASALLLLLVAFRVLSGGAPSSDTQGTTVPSGPGTTLSSGTSVLPATTLPGSETVPGAATTIPGTATTIPGTATTAPVLSTELSVALVTDLVASLESLEISRAQTVVAEPLDQVAYATFIAKHQSGQRITIVGEPVAFSGTPAASVTLQRTSAQGAQVATETVVLTQDPVSLSWRFRSLPTL